MYSGKSFTQAIDNPFILYFRRRELSEMNILETDVNRVILRKKFNLKVVPARMIPIRGRGEKKLL